MPLRNPFQVQTRVQFVVSESLDLINAMYFTSFVQDYEGVDGWPAETRPRMDVELRDELDFLFTFPLGEPGVMGALQEVLFNHPGTWSSVEALLEFIRGMDLGLGEIPQSPGVQGLLHYVLRYPCKDGNDDFVEPGDRAEFEQFIKRSDADAQTIMWLYDRPEVLRRRMATLVERFHERHYAPDAERRLEFMGRSVEERPSDSADLAGMARTLTGHDAICFNENASRYEKFVFVPSADVGLYSNCGEIPPVHGLYYNPHRRRPAQLGADDESTERVAQVYKALSDPQRLRILGLLREGELYAQEIADKTGLHQSVVSRHLSFLKAVGLVNGRKQNNMRFFSLNTEMREELSRAIDLFLPAPS